MYLGKMYLNIHFERVKKKMLNQNYVEVGVDSPRV